MLKIFASISLTAVACLAQCPLEFIKVDPNVKQSWSRVGRSMGSSLGSKPHSGKSQELPPDFVVHVKNISNKDIRGLKLQAAYFDATEDLHTVPVAWNSAANLKANTDKSLTWENPIYSDRSAIGRGWIVVPIKILYEDGTSWTANDSPDSLAGCYGEYWKDSKHPRLTKVPVELLKAGNENQTSPSK